MATGKTLESRKPEKLKDHALNKRVFGDPKAGADWGEFVASVKASGVIEPLIITEANLILSGHRRKAAAVEAGLDEVPVIVRHDLNGDGLDADFAWFNANHARVMTVEQRAKWYETRKTIEEQAAKARQETTQAKAGAKVGEKFTPPTKHEKSGKSADIAAADAGMSRPTAEKALAVTKAIDEAEAAGDTEKADDLRTTLNTQSVAAAHRKATGAEKKKPQRKERFADRAWEKPFGELVRWAQSRAKACGGPLLHAKVEKELGGVHVAIEKWQQEFPA